MKIRKATKRDVSTIWKLTRELAEYENFLHVCKVTKKDIEKIFFGKKTAAECYLIEENSQAIGMGKLLTIMDMYKGTPFFLLRDFIVQEKYRGSGYGKKFIKFAAKLAHKRGYSHIDWVVMNWNKPAIAFYKSVGAVIPQFTPLRIGGDRLEEIASNGQKKAKSKTQSSPRKKKG